MGRVQKLADSILRWFGGRLVGARELERHAYQFETLEADRDAVMALSDTLEGRRAGLGQRAYSPSVPPRLDLIAEAPSAWVAPLEPPIELVVREPAVTPGLQPLARHSRYDRLLVAAMPRSATNYYRAFLAEFFGLERVRALSEVRPEVAPLPPRWESYERDPTYRHLGPGQLACLHISLTPDLSSFLDRHEELLVVHTYRDIRDVVVSSTRYIRHQPGHYCHGLFSRLSFDEALMCNIVGCVIPFELQPAALQQRNRARVALVFGGHRHIAERSRGWLREPRAVQLRYERFFDGPPGGPGAEHFIEAFGRVGVRLERDAVTRLQERLTFQRFSGGRRRGEAEEGHHYYKGVAGEWRTAFTAAHTAVARAYFGQWLIDFGYENGVDWG